MSTLPPAAVHGEEVTSYLWYSFDGLVCSPSLSGPFFCLGSIRFTFRSYKHICGLVINDTCDEQPNEEYAWLASLRWQHPLHDPGPVAMADSSTTYGCGKVAIITSHSHTHLHSYSWPSYDTCCHSLPTSVYLEKECFVHDDHYIKPLMDKASGHVIIPASIQMGCCLGFLSSLS